MDKDRKNPLPTKHRCFAYAKSSYSVTLNFLLLCSVAFGVVTVTRPVVAPVGTTAVIYVFDSTVNLVAAVPLNETALVPMNPCPRISTVAPTFPDVGSKLTNGLRPRFRE